MTTHTVESLTKLLKQCRNSVEMDIDVMSCSQWVDAEYFASIQTLLGTIDALPDAAQPVQPTDEVRCVCGATWERHGNCNYEMVYLPDAAHIAQPV